ncbi:hypothetical protein [Pedobacter frigiditerrae]|uniref:hypothetical protein n=1 Tax=Pedobacter frigiditerrae TaxID=2530452 RepID=UPI0013F14483|nr:hypothetical protein [Pedobacter frigiditerrae]
MLTSLNEFSYAQTNELNSKIINEYDKIREIAPREKLYIHFDKSIYLPVDTIWFKGYLVNTTLNNSSAISGLIYTELINADGEVVQTLALPTILGLTWGAFPLKEETYPPGNYTFRAYTNWMQNFGDTYIFKKEIKILNLDADQQAITQNGKNASKKNITNQLTNTRNKQEIDIQFLPEGGSWIADLPQKMAFKAIDKSGKGIKINGEIFDSKQNKVTDFKSNTLGMGYFTMFPKLDETYTAKVNFQNGLATKNLPKATAKGTIIALRSSKKSDSLIITVASSLSNQPLTLIGQSRGVICFTANINANDVGRTVRITKDIFPTGVSQILLLDDKKQILNERNFFLNLNDELKVNISSSSLTYNVRDSIPIHLKVSDYLNNPVEASFSIAVTDDNQVLKDSLSENNILTYLLMTSDLKGEVENPGYYFQNQSDEIYNDLDALMLTQGWVSYNWDITKKPLLKAEKEYTISGRIINIMNKPSPHAKIILLGKNKTTMMLDTLTNQNGEFVFDKLPLMDSASFVIQALNAKGKKGTLGITVNEFVRAPFILPKKSYIENNEVIDSIVAQQIDAKNEVYKAALKSGISLREVKITGKKIIRGSKNLNGAGEASQTLTEENLSQIPKKSLYDALAEKVKGFREGMRRKSNIRDYFVNGDLARFIFDGVEIDFFFSPTGSPGGDEYYHFVKGFLDYYNAEDIRGIEVLSNGYSFRYKNQFMEPLDDKTYSFIEITTKTGAGPFLKKSANMYLIKPLNYGNNKVFYSPKYNSTNKKEKLPDYRSTIYWNPNVLTNVNGEADVSFFSADKKGTYTVWIEGIDTKGGLGLRRMRLTIK